MLVLMLAAVLLGRTTPQTLGPSNPQASKAAAAAAAAAEALAVAAQAAGQQAVAAVAAVTLWSSRRPTLVGVPIYPQPRSCRWAGGAVGRAVASGCSDRLLGGACMGCSSSMLPLPPHGVQQQPEVQLRSDHAAVMAARAAAAAPAGSAVEAQSTALPRSLNLTLPHTLVPTQPGVLCARKTLPEPHQVQEETLDGAAYWDAALADFGEEDEDEGEDELGGEDEWENGDGGEGEDEDVEVEGEWEGGGVTLGCDMHVRRGCWC